MLHALTYTSWESNRSSCTWSECRISCYHTNPWSWATWWKDHDFFVNMIYRRMKPWHNRKGFPLSAENLFKELDKCESVKEMFNSISFPVNRLVPKNKFGYVTAKSFVKPFFLSVPFWFSWKPLVFWCFRGGSKGLKQIKYSMNVNSFSCTFLCFFQNSVVIGSSRFFLTSNLYEIPVLGITLELSDIHGGFLIKKWWMQSLKTDFCWKILECLKIAGDQATILNWACSY